MTFSECKFATLYQKNLQLCIKKVTYVASRHGHSFHNLMQSYNFVTSWLLAKFNVISLLNNHYLKLCNDCPTAINSLLEYYVATLYQTTINMFLLNSNSYVQSYNFVTIMLFLRAEGRYSI